MGIKDGVDDGDDDECGCGGCASRRFSSPFVEFNRHREFKSRRRMTHIKMLYKLIWCPEIVFELVDSGANLNQM